MKVIYLLLVCTALAVGTSNRSEAYTGKASWYSVEACKYNPDESCPTASGKSLYDLEREGVRFCAMWNEKFGSTFLVRNLANGKATIVKCLDRGPAKRLGRAIDLGKHAFQDIADLGQGIIDVSITRVVELTKGDK